MAHTFQIRAKTSTLLASKSDNAWALSMEVKRTDSDTSTTFDMSKVAFKIWLQHYWNFNRVETNIYDGGHFASGEGSGTASMSSAITHRDTAANPPKIYPATEKVKSILEYSFTGAGQLLENGTWTNIVFDIKDSGDRRLKYFGVDDGDVESSYSYINSTTMADVTTITGYYDGVLVSGTEPDFSTVTHVMIPIDNCSHISEDNPTTSYEGLNYARISNYDNWQAPGHRFRPVTTWSNVTVPTSFTLKKAEIIFSSTDNNLREDVAIDLCKLDSKPDPSPTWNEMEANFGAVHDSFTASSTETQTAWHPSQWRFTSSLIDAELVSNWNAFGSMNGWGLKYHSEAVSSYWEDPQVNTDDAGTSNLKPFIIVAYTGSTPPVTTNNQRFFVW